MANVRHTAPFTRRFLSQMLKNSLNFFKTFFFFLKNEEKNERKILGVPQLGGGEYGDFSCTNTTGTRTHVKHVLGGSRSPLQQQQQLKLPPKCVYQQQKFEFCSFRCRQIFWQLKKGEINFF